MSWVYLGVDTGGTFTDFVAIDDSGIAVHKVLSTPGNPHHAILRGITDLGLEETMRSGNLWIVHGTTVATNAALEAKGVRPVYITNPGLTDVPLIGRQTRRELYNLNVSKPEVRMLGSLEVNSRVHADGSVAASPDETELLALDEKLAELAPEAVAINFLFSYLNDADERLIEARYRDKYFVSRSSFVLPETGEYERGMATLMNASLGPLIEDYLSTLGEQVSPSPLSIMQSSGVTIGAPQASRRAVNLLLSGPVGGLNAAQFMDLAPAMTFDMGGTSTDVSLLTRRGIQLTRGAHIADTPIAIPMADIHTIGAGGGSIVSIDPGGLLEVGPTSAGADPGPACYGKGAGIPTVTDANLAMGRLQPGEFLGGEMALDADAAEAALSPVAKQLDLSVTELAAGVIDLANEHMTQALRFISIQRGHNPRDFTLVCFGGAGGLHLCDLAERLGMTRAVVPIHGGVLSALGMLVSQPGREIVHTQEMSLHQVDEAALEKKFEEIESGGRKELADEKVEIQNASRSIDLRYVGQTHSLNIPFTSLEELAEDFHTAHELRYGHRMNKAVEVVNLRIKLTGEGPSVLLPNRDDVEQQEPRTVELPDLGPTTMMNRAGLVTGKAYSGPMLITEDFATTLIKPDWDVAADDKGNLTITRRTT